MLCILCVTPSDEIIEIFNEDGINLDACNVICKHFWLKPNAKDPNAKAICRSCWSSVDSFHRFFQMVEEAHAKLSTTKSFDLDNAFDDDNSYAYEELSTEYDIKLEPVNETIVDLGEHENEEGGTSCDSDTRIFGEKACPIQKAQESPAPYIKVKIKAEDCKTESAGEERSQSVSDSESDIPLSMLSAQSSPKDSSLNNTKDDGGNVRNSKKYEEKKVPCQKFDEIIRENMKLSCTICQKSLSSFFLLKEHYQCVHNEVGYVMCCEKKFESRHGLVHHILLHNDPEHFKCDECGRVLASKKSLKFHKKTHLNKDQTFPCEKCKKTFFRKEKLEKHMKKHVRREQICEQCGKVTRSLRDHQHREHSNIPKEPVQCTKCQKFLSDNSSLRRHVKYQHPETETSNVCNICGKISSSGYGLQRHIFNMHKTERRHKCTLCGKAFKFAQILRPDVNDVNAKVICTPCWCTLESFHKFYLQVEKAHAQFQDSIERHDLKLENDNITPQHVDQTVVEPFDEIPADLLNADIKLEVQEDIEVGLLPEVATAETDKREELSDVRKHSTDSKKTNDQDAPPASSTRSRTSADKSYTELQSSSDDEKDNDNTADWQNQNSDNDDDDSDYIDSSSRTSKGAESLSTTKKRGRPKKSESKETPRKRKRASEEQSKKMERIQEYDELIAKNIKLTCSICLNVSPNFAVLKKHYRVVHNECGYATCCGKKFRKRGVLVDHIYTHQNPEYFKCEKCGKVLANRKCLDCHMLTHDTEKQRIYQCDQCTMSFYTRPLLTRHLQTHIAVRNIKCPDCDKFFSTQDILRTHINNVHNSAYNRICDQCGKLFRRPDAFRRHQLEHDGITQPLVPCDKCGVKLTSKYGLKRHMESMHPETEVTHVCSTCGKVAPSAAALQRHISYMHKMERKYKCPMCDKAFKKTGGLKVSTTANRSHREGNCI